MSLTNSTFFEQINLLWDASKCLLIHHPFLVLGLTSHATIHKSVFINKSNQSDKNK